MTTIGTQPGELIPCSRGDMSADDLDRLVDRLCHSHAPQDLYLAQVAILHLAKHMRAPAAKPESIDVGAAVKRAAQSIATKQAGRGSAADLYDPPAAKPEAPLDSDIAARDARIAKLEQALCGAANVFELSGLNEAGRVCREAIDEARRIS